MTLLIDIDLFIDIRLHLLSDIVIIQWNPILLMMTIFYLMTWWYWRHSGIGIRWPAVMMIFIVNPVLVIHCYCWSLTTFLILMILSTETFSRWPIVDDDHWWWLGIQLQYYCRWLLFWPHIWNDYFHSFDSLLIHCYSIRVDDLPFYRSSLHSCWHSLPSIMLHSIHCWWCWYGEALTVVRYLIHSISEPGLPRSTVHTTVHLRYAGLRAPRLFTSVATVPAGLRTAHTVTGPPFTHHHICTPLHGSDGLPLGSPRFPSHCAARHATPHRHSYTLAHTTRCLFPHTHTHVHVYIRSAFMDAGFTIHW